MEPREPLRRCGQGKAQSRRDGEIGQGKLALVDEQVAQIGAVESQRQLAKRSVTAGAHLLEDCGNAFAQFARDRPRRARQRGGALRVGEVGPIEFLRTGAHASTLSTATTKIARAPARLSDRSSCPTNHPSHSAMHWTTTGAGK